LKELLEYLTVFAPIHLRTIYTGTWDMKTWGDAWRAEQAVTKVRNLEEIKETIASQSALFRELV